MSSRKPLLPKDELEEILAKWEKENNPMTTQELLDMWRKEWHMSWCVYGDKVVQAKKNTRAWREAKKALARRMHMVKVLGQMLRDKLNLDGQTNLFDKPKQ